jgi:peptide deformylase
VNILAYPNDILRRKCTSVEEITNDLVFIARDMMDVMKEHGGIGLAAPQVGFPLKFFVMDTTEVDKENGFKGVLFNPVIFSKSDKFMPYVEGCLSFIGEQQPTCRSSSIEIGYVDAYKKLQKVQLKGISAICAQHELDHLYGVLFIDYNQTGKKRKAKQ